MAKPYLSLRIEQDDIDGEVSFGLSASNGHNTTQLGFWGYRGDLVPFAEELLKFPRDAHHLATYKLGEDNDTWAYYLFLRVFCIDSVGHSALEIQTAIPGPPPHACRSQFSIVTEPASLNLLGHQLLDLAAAKISEFTWEAHAL